MYTSTSELICCSITSTLGCHGIYVRQERAYGVAVLMNVKPEPCVTDVTSSLPAATLLINTRHTINLIVDCRVTSIHTYIEPIVLFDFSINVFLFKVRAHASVLLTVEELHLELVLIIGHKMCIIMGLSYQLGGAME